MRLQPNPHPAKELPRKLADTGSQPSGFGGQTQRHFTSGARTSYDDIPYLGNPRYETHPNCLATVGMLLGMKPAPLDSCRCLELGCGMGGTLSAVALALRAGQ